MEKKERLIALFAEAKGIDPADARWFCLSSEVFSGLDRGTAENESEEALLMALLAEYRDARIYPC